MPDAVAAILFALGRSDLDGAINVAGPNPVTNAQFTQSLARAIHRPAFLPAPAFALRLALGEMAGEALLASARVFPSRLISVGFQFAHPTVDVALAAALASGP
jgi:NAD dependent epimerase/dehydratase family enzyme